MPEWTPLDILAAAAELASASAPAPAPAPVPASEPVPTRPLPVLAPRPGLVSTSSPSPLSPSPQSSVSTLPLSSPLSPASSPPVPPRPSPSPTSSKKKGPRHCPKCGKEFNFKNFADHVKVHRMKGDKEGGPAIPCKQCAKHPERCRVAIYPRDMGTFACLCCLQSHKSCEYTKVKEGAPTSGHGGRGHRHPKLLRRRGLPIKDILN